MKKYTIIAIVILVTTTMYNSVYSQNNFENNNENKIALKNTIGFSPFHLITNGFRVEYDRAITDDLNHWLIFSPSFYMSYNEDLYNDIEKYIGFSLEVKHRVFVSEANIRPKGFYFQYGPFYQYSLISDERNISTQYVDEFGVTYYNVENKKIDVNMHKLGASFQMGYQFLFRERVYLDLYLGTGIRVSFDNYNSGISPWYNNNFFQLGYSGTLINGGVRIGFTF